MKTYLYRAFNLKSTITFLAFVSWRPSKTIVSCDLFIIIILIIIIINFFRRVCICNSMEGVKFGINFTSCSENGYFAIIATMSTRPSYTCTMRLSFTISG